MAAGRPFHCGFASITRAPLSSALRATGESYAQTAYGQGNFAKDTRTILLNDFGGFKRDGTEPERSSKIYVPIDCEAIAKDLKVDPDIIFGRLYYHLDKKYGYAKEGGAKVHLFTPVIGEDKNAVNFPLLSAVLAELHQSWFRFTAPLVVSGVALVLSVVSLVCGGS